MRQVAAEKNKSKKGETKVMDYKFDESMKGMLTPPRSGKTQDFNILKLATTPGKGDLSFPSTTDREKNKVKPQPQKELEDLFERQNQNTNGATSIPATFLRVTVTV